VRAALHAGLFAPAAVAHPAAVGLAPNSRVASTGPLAPIPAAAEGRQADSDAKEARNEASLAEPAPLRGAADAPAGSGNGPQASERDRTALQERSGGDDPAAVAAIESPQAAAATAGSSVASAPVQSASRPSPGSASAILRFHIVPWGEVHLDGRNLGAAPPLGQIALAPGVHRIEVRNPGFPSHAETIDLGAGEQVGIRHRFE